MPLSSTTAATADPAQLALVVALVLALLAAGGWVALAWARWRRARGVARNRLAGTRGERRAGALLEAAGFRIEEVQPTATIEVIVDGERHRFRVKADFLVSRGRRRFVAEAKGGVEVATVAHRGTRRQLLEYARAFPDVDGLLLVDAVRGGVQRVVFPGPR